MNLWLFGVWLRWLENVINATRPAPSPAEQAYVLECIAAEMGRRFPH